MTIFVIGGTNFAQGALHFVQAYDPKSNSWSWKSEMPSGRGLTGTATGENGLVYSIGGAVYPSTTALDTVESYDPEADEWASAPSLQTKRADLGAGTDEDGLICAFGGYDETGQILRSAECLRPRGHHHGGYHGDDSRR